MKTDVKILKNICKPHFHSWLLDIIKPSVLIFYLTVTVGIEHVQYPLNESHFLPIQMQKMASWAKVKVNPDFSRYQSGPSEHKHAE